MRIIKAGKDLSNKLYFHCPQCDCFWEVEMDECRKVYVEPLGVTKYACDCPNKTCGNKGVHNIAKSFFQNLLTDSRDF